jgi:hypothetical protein
VDLGLIVFDRDIDGSIYEILEGNTEKAIEPQLGAKENSAAGFSPPIITRDK